MDMKIRNNKNLKYVGPTCVVPLGDKPPVGHDGLFVREIIVTRSQAEFQLDHEGKPCTFRVRLLSTDDSVSAGKQDLEKIRKNREHLLGLTMTELLDREI